MTTASKDWKLGASCFTTDAVMKLRLSIAPSSMWRWILLTVVMLTVAVGCACVALVIRCPTTTENQQSAFGALETVWKIGFGASVQVLGEKITG